MSPCAHLMLSRRTRRLKAVHVRVQVLVLCQGLRQDLQGSIGTVQQLDQELQRCMQQVRQLATPAPAAALELTLISDELGGASTSPVRVLSFAHCGEAHSAEMRGVVGADWGVHNLRRM
jgi:hypothetical protein